MFRTCFRKPLFAVTAILLGVFLLGVFLVLFCMPAVAQGVPASVTSQGFGGNVSRSPGVPASVTSHGSVAAPHHPVGVFPRCCINPLFPTGRNPINDGHHRHNRGGFPGGYAPGIVYYSTPYDTYDNSGDAAAQDAQQAAIEQQEYRGGPTVFDRRGPGGSVTDTNREPRAAEPRAAEQADSSAAKVSDQPQTVLVFKDGHTLEVSNYAIIGSTLFDLTPGHRRKVGLNELDLSATTKENDNRGVDFRLPPGAQGS